MGTREPWSNFSMLAQDRQGECMLSILQHAILLFIVSIINKTDRRTARRDEKKGSGLGEKLIDLQERGGK